MGPLDPRDDAWRRYYQAHPEVLASWGEQNGRQPNCGCPACVKAGLPARRQPYVDDYATLAEGYRRSAKIDREEADGYDYGDPRRSNALSSAVQFDFLAEAAEKEGI